MCGIVAQIYKKDSKKKIDTTKMMLDKIAHRGEELFQHEIYEEEGFTLGANRLAITSSSSEKQPFISQNHNTLVVLNGEIYNYKRLLDRYKIRDVYNDGEALANLLEIKGIDILDELDGIFSFISIHKKENKVYAVRDFLGIKPLYYAMKENHYIFASEIKSLAYDSEISSIKELGIGTWISFAWVHSLPILKEKRKYFDIDDLKDKTILTKDNFLEILEESVRLQVQSTEPIGVYLSGGIDSSAIYALARKHHPNIIPLILSSANGDEDLDSIYAKRLAEYFGDKYVMDFIGREEEIFENIPKIIEISEGFEPNLIKQSSASYFIAKLAKKANVKIVLTGEGADELFCGYPDFRIDDNWKQKRYDFLKDLNKTQLKRVDRTSMYFTTEARVPFLTPKMLSATLNQENKRYFFNSNYNKIILRESMKGILPDWIRFREKIVLSEGLGLKGNSLEDGLFTQIINEKISDKVFKDTQDTFSSWNINSKEDTYYFNIFKDLGYTKASFLKNRITANKIHTIVD